MIRILTPSHVFDKYRKTRDTCLAVVAGNLDNCCIYNNRSKQFAIRINKPESFAVARSWFYTKIMPTSDNFKLHLSPAGDNKSYSENNPRVTQVKNWVRHKRQRVNCMKCKTHVTLVTQNNLDWHWGTVTLITHIFIIMATKNPYVWCL